MSNDASHVPLDASALDTSLLSHYETPICSPINTQCRSPRDVISSLASTQLDFTFSDRYEYALGDNHQITCDESCSNTSTLVTESNIPSDRRVSKVSTNPFVDSYDEYYRNEPKLHWNQILNDLEKVSSEFVKLQSLEEQILSFSLQLKSLRENLFQQNRDSLDLIQKFIEHSNCKSSKQLRHVQTQTSAELQSHQLCHSDFICNDNADNDSQLTFTGIDSLIENCAHTIEINKEMKYRFRKLPSMVKGYLIRRLIQTEKVQQLKRTIGDTSRILIQFKSNLFREGKLVVTHQDILFHQRLCIQLENSCKEFFSVFFETSIAKQMKMIANHRDYLKNLMYLKEKRSNSVLSQSTMRSNHSSLMLKSIH